MRFSASKMSRIVKCPGSKKIQEAYPVLSGYAATEGTIAAKIAAEVLQTDKPLSSFLNQSIDNVYIDQKMLHHLQLYVDNCHPSGSVEQKLQLNYDAFTLTGTPDYWDFDSETGILLVKDLKYGYGWVEVYENWQLLTYASLILYSQITSGLLEPCKTIELTIIQPRASHPDGPVRSWTFDADLINFYYTSIVEAMHKAILPEPPVQTGPHCRYCNGLLNCHAARAAAALAIDYAGTAGHSELTPEALALEIEIVNRAGKMLTQRQIALEETGLAMCKAGKIVPGWEARNTLAPMAWSINPIAVGDAMGINLRAPEKAITPTQAVNRKLLTADSISSFAGRPAGSMKLKRINHTKAKRILKKE